MRSRSHRLSSSSTTRIFAAIFLQFSAAVSGCSVGAGLLRRLLRFFDFLCRLTFVHVVPLAGSVRAGDTLPRLQSAQIFLRSGAVVCFRCLGLAILLSFLALLLGLLLALAVFLLLLRRCQRTLFCVLGGRSGRIGRPGRRRLDGCRVDARRRNIAVPHLAILVDPLVQLRLRRGGEADDRNEKQYLSHFILPMQMPRGCAPGPSNSG